MARDSYVKSVDIVFKPEVDKKAIDDVKKTVEDIADSTKNVEIGFKIDRKKLDSLTEQMRASFSASAIAKTGIFEDSESLRKVQEAFEQFEKLSSKINMLKATQTELMKVAGTSEEASQALKAVSDELAKLLKERQSMGLSDDLDELNSSKDFMTQFKKGFKEAFDEMNAEIKDFKKLGKNAFDFMQSKIASWAKDALESLKKFAEDAIKEMKEMASYDLQNSAIYNEDAANLYMETGLQGAEAYAFQKALSSQSFHSLDDYLTAIPTMSDNQRDYMKEIYEISLQQYERDLEVAQSFQEFEKEYEVFKKEMQQSLIDFFMNNKDVIIGTIQGIMSLLDMIADAVSFIADLFGSSVERSDREKKQAVADILGVSSSTLTNNTNNTSVNVNNTFNGVGKQDQSWLANTGQMTYQQIINALT